MTQRSIFSGDHPLVTVHAGANVVVRGVEGERVSAESGGRWGLKVERKRDGVKVQLGMSGSVEVPAHSHVKVYAGKNAEIDGVGGDISAVAGLHLAIRRGGRLMQGSAGGSMDIDCAELGARAMKLQAGGNLRLFIHNLGSAHFKVDDLGGYWEGRIGAGEIALTLKSGGDVTLVTDQDVAGMPPDYILGQIQKPARNPSSQAGK